MVIYQTKIAVGVVLLSIIVGLLGFANLANAHADVEKVVKVDLNNINYSEITDNRVFKINDLKSFLNSNTRANIELDEDGKISVNDLQITSTAVDKSCVDDDACWKTAAVPYSDFGFLGAGTANGNWPQRGVFEARKMNASIYFITPSGGKIGVENLKPGNSFVYTVNGTKTAVTGTAVVLWS